MTKVSPSQIEINSVIVLYSNGKIQEALDTVEILTRSYPNEPLLYNISGVCYKTIDKLDEAIKSFEKALAIKPNYTEVHYNLGVVLKDLGQLDAAVKSYEKALAINPSYANACNNLGITLKELGQLDASVKNYKKALAIKPDFAEAHNNLGNALDLLGQLDAAVKCYENAVAYNPDYSEAHNNLGNAFKNLAKLDAAVKCYEKAVALKPDYAEAYHNLGNALLSLKRLDEALVSYERAIVLKPDIDFILGDLLHTKMQLCIWDDLSSQLDELRNKINSSKKVINPFPLLALIDNPELQMKTAETFVNEKYPQSHVLSKIERYQKHQKIRIGYFSADFRNHPVSTLKTELYELHDRSQFEIYAFSYGPDTKDEMNLKIKSGVDHFHDVQKMSDNDLAILSRSFEIDIAVDLGGFTQDSRTGVFALQAAPIQVNYLGYSGTMAANYMDYLIADHTLIPEEKKHHYLEKIVYMPNSFMVNDTKTKLSNRLFTRVDTGLPTNGFVFCCFNNHYKITPYIFIGWMQILKAVEDSVLWLSEGNSSVVNNLIKEAKKNGVDENRLIFASRLDSMKDHLNRIKQADLFIDTLPYNAHATSSDALRMGLPVLTCVGNSFASRVAASLLNAVNLPELITTTQEQYESLAIQLATHPEKLKTIKDKLVNNLPTTPLYDTPLFTRHLESAYLTMYDRYQQGLDPDYIYVEH